MPNAYLPVNTTYNKRANGLEEYKRAEVHLEMDIQPTGGKNPVKGRFDSNKLNDISGRCGVVSNRTKHDERKERL